MTRARPQVLFLMSCSQDGAQGPAQCLFKPQAMLVWKQDQKCPCPVFSLRARRPLRGLKSKAPIFQMGALRLTTPYSFSGLPAEASGRWEELRIQPYPESPGLSCPNSSSSEDGGCSLYC